MKTVDASEKHHLRARILVVIFALGIWQISLSACRPVPTELRPRCAEGSNKALKFLAANQRRSGSFATYYWPTDNPAKAKPVETSFTVSQVLYSLTFRDDSGSARRVRERAVSYLLSQREPPGVWRYYTQPSNIPLSPDVDDTALAWAGLKRSGYSIAPEALTAVRTSRNEAGLFNTWIGHPSTWVGIDSRDIDAVVNLNALLLFGLSGETVDIVCKYAVEQAQGDGLRRGSVYYPSPLAFTYALSRAFAEGDVRCLNDAVPKIRDATLSLQQNDGGWGNDVETALGVLTLLNVGYRGPALERGLEVIVARQSSDGGWALAPAYRSAVAPWRYGSRSLTTALCLEALTKYLKQ